MERQLDVLLPEFARLVDEGTSQVDGAYRLNSQDLRYRLALDLIPVSFWEEDYSRLAIAFEKMRSRGIRDLDRYIDQHPEFLQDAAKLITIIDVNQETLKMVGLQSKGELVGSSARILTEGSQAAFRAEILALWNGESFFQTDGTTFLIDGTKRDISVRICIPTTCKPLCRMYIVVLDITEQRKSIEELRRSEERFKAVFESAADYIYMKDLDLKITDANPAFRNIFRSAIPDIVGCTAEDLYGAEAGKHINEIDRLVLSGRAIEEEYTRPVNGAMRTFHDIRVPLKDSKAETIGLLCISRDITERLRATRPKPILDLGYPSPAMRTTLERARLAAATDSVVLLLGESGSGKDHMARYIHACSRRNNGPFFSVNCAALSPDIAESELFGHESGAFTGARARKRGLVELAEGGTLLLNEIGELSLSMQSKLLTFLDDKSFMHVGGEKILTVNARIIAATHRDLKSEVEAGRFLSALFYRLDVFSLHIPPLRERLEDIPMLVDEILNRLVTEKHFPHGRRPAPEALRKFSRHTWPGNIRELRNVLERSLILPEDSFPYFPSEEAQPDVCGNTMADLSFSHEGSLAETRKEITRSLCLEALRRSNGNKRQAAKLLGISRYSLYRYLKAAHHEGDSVTQAENEGDFVTQTENEADRVSW